MTLWTEPASGTMTDTDKGYYHDVGYGQFSYSKIRRFVVIRKRLHSCLCLPITSYGGQGSRKAGIKIEDHALVYREGTPAPLPDVKMTKEPFAIIVEAKGETLSPESQINFAKVYTVEHNVKIKHVGRLHKRDKRRLNRYYAESMGLEDTDEDETAPDSPPSQDRSSQDRRDDRRDQERKRRSDKESSHKYSDRGKSRR